MQSRKELAEAGRRKLEEFRKAKAQGKASGPNPGAKPTEADNAAEQPASATENGFVPASVQNAALGSRVPDSTASTHERPIAAPLAAANGHGYSNPAPAGGGSAPPVGIWPAGGAPPNSASHHDVSYGTRPALAVPADSNAHQQPNLPPAELAWQPPAAAPPTQPTPPSASDPAGKPPPTTFVVLQNAPIPFGAPVAPTGLAPRTSSSGAAGPVRISNSGAAYPWLAANDVPTTASAQYGAIGSNSSYSTSSYGLPQPPASVGAPEPASHSMSFWEREQPRGAPQEVPSYYGSSALIGSLTDKSGGAYDPSFFGSGVTGGDKNVQQPYQPYQPNTFAPTLDSYVSGGANIAAVGGAYTVQTPAQARDTVYGHGDTAGVVYGGPSYESASFDKAVMAAMAAKYDGHGAGSRTFATEPVVSQAPAAQAPAEGTSSTSRVPGAEVPFGGSSADSATSARSASEPAAAAAYSQAPGAANASAFPSYSVLNWRPAQPATAPEPAPLAALAAAAGAGAPAHGVGEAPSDVDSRAPWISYTPAAAPAAADSLIDTPQSIVTPPQPRQQQQQPGSLAAGQWGNDAFGLRPVAVAPQAQDVASEYAAGGGESATAAAAAPAAALPDALHGYDQLSDSYLGSRYGPPVAGTPNAAAPASASGFLPSVPEAVPEAAKGPSGQVAEGAHTAVSPAWQALPLSFGAISPASGVAAAFSTGSEPTTSAPPAAGAGAGMEQQQTSAPEPPSSARAPDSAPSQASSRFAWLFGSPPSTKQEHSAAATRFPRPPGFDSGNAATALAEPSGNSAMPQPPTSVAPVSSQSTSQTQDVAAGPAAESLPEPPAASTTAPEAAWAVDRPAPSPSWDAKAATAAPSSSFLSDTAGGYSGHSAVGASNGAWGGSAAGGSASQGLGAKAGAPGPWSSSATGLAGGLAREVYGPHGTVGAPAGAPTYPGSVLDLAGCGQAADRYSSSVLPAYMQNRTVGLGPAGRDDSLPAFQGAEARGGAAGALGGAERPSTSPAWGPAEQDMAAPGGFFQSPSFGTSFPPGGYIYPTDANLPPFAPTPPYGSGNLQPFEMSHPYVSQSLPQPDAAPPSVRSSTPSMSAPHSGASLPPLGTLALSPSVTYSAANLPPFTSAPPRQPGPSTAANPQFSAAASYLSAYSTGGTHAAAAYGAPAPTASTSSYLDSYLDNLLSNMSGNKDGGGGAEDKAHAGAGTANGSHGGPGPSASGSPRTSHTGDAAAAGGPHGHDEAAGVHSHNGDSHADGAEDGAGNGGALGDRGFSNSDLAGADAAGGSGRGGMLSQLDSSAQLRGRPSRRPSMDSVYPHATGHMHGAGGGGNGVGSGGSRAQFAALQQHIDELTEEKLDMARGLKQQVRINEQLAEENEELTRQYNARGAVVEELERKMKRYEKELEAQALSLEGFSEERNAVRSSYVEASSRAQALASEVVGLEAQVLQLKSSVLKAERTAEEAQQRARKLEKQVDTLTKEASSRSQEMQQLQLKGRNLVIMLKQAEAKLQAAEEKLATQAALGGLHGSMLANGHAPPVPASVPAPPPSPPAKQTVEQDVQCDLASELVQAALEQAIASAENASAAQPRTHADSNGTADTTMAPALSDAGQAAARATGDGGASVAGSQAASDPGTQLALVPVPSVRSNDSPDTPDRTAQLVDWTVARPIRDAPSAVVAERALSALDNSAVRGFQFMPEGLDAVALQLARWLPAGPVSGGDPVAVMVEEELRLLQSIHELLGNFEHAQEASAGQIMELQDRVVSLTQDNDELRGKLELQTQRLELQMQGMDSGVPLSLHQTPSPMTTGGDNAASMAAITPMSGANYQPSPAIFPQADSQATPTRSVRMASGSPMENPGGESGTTAQSGRQSWMGYLFRPRQKKRVRSSIL